MKQINDLALKSKELRTDAFQLEQEAINIVNEEVLCL